MQSGNVVRNVYVQQEGDTVTWEFRETATLKMWFYVMFLQQLLCFSQHDYQIV